MRNSTKIAAALALILTAIMVAAGGIDDESPAETAASPFAVTPDNETPVRATKGDRLDASPDIREIAGVTLVLRNIDPTVR